MEQPLDNPVYHALLTRDAAFSFGSGGVRYFDEQMSPFAGFALENRYGFKELHEQLPEGRRILYASVTPIEIPSHWKCVAAIEGLQFVFDPETPLQDAGIEPTPLGAGHVDEMIELTELTRPGPFGPRTIEFGHYYGIFEDGRLAAMTGQRLHLPGLSEISAVCTHPRSLGKGYAGALLWHQIALIRRTGQIPFLHVRSDNQRAISLYERIGFRLRGPMHFYFMRRN